MPEVHIPTLVNKWPKMKGLFLPSFQREFVWDEEKMKNFFESIIKGYPIGAIILWKPSRKLIENDKFAKPLNGNRNYLDENYYVLDGQQRLTSLFLLFNGWKIEREGEIIERHPISISQSKKLFIGRHGVKKGVDLYDVIRAFIFVDPEAQQKLREKVSPTFLKELAEIAGTIQNYEMPVYIIDTSETDEEEKLKEMAEVFVRINRSGVRIGGPELMLSFLAGQLGGKFKDRLSEVYNTLENKYNLKLPSFIRFVLSNLGVKQSEITKVKSFKSTLKKLEVIGEEEKLNVIAFSEKSFLEVMKLLKNELGIVDLTILPSQNSLIPLAYYFYHSRKTYEDLSEFEKREITKWFILTNFFGRYSSRTDKNIQDDLDLIKNSLEKFPAEELIKGIGKEKIGKEDIEKGLKRNVLRGTSGKAFLFILYILLAKNDADDWTGNRIAFRNINKELDKHHIFPRDFLKDNLSAEDEDDSDELINNIGNITFINKSKNEEIQDLSPEDYLKEIPEESREKHFIPKEECTWKIDEYEEFCKMRITKMFEAGKTLFPFVFKS